MESLPVVYGTVSGPTGNLRRSAKKLERGSQQLFELFTQYWTVTLWLVGSTEVVAFIR